MHHRSIRPLAFLLLLASSACAPAGREDDDDDDDGCADPADCAPSCEDDPEGVGCACDAHEPEMCWTGGADAVPGEGACRTGLHSCDDGHWSSCVGEVVPSVEQCNGLDDDCDGTVDDGCATGDDCDERTRWIYVVSSANELIRFEPDSRALVEVGTIRCADAPAGYHPFSMAVDRAGSAWVLFVEDLGLEPGQLFRVSVEDASCEPIRYEPGQEDFWRFGMGFVSDEAGGDAETLFVAGGHDLLGGERLARIDTATLVLTPVGDLDGSPELTGTGDAELWGFFPETDPSTVTELDRDTAAAGQSFDLGGVSSGDTLAWAFAFWGGRFYLFLETIDDRSTNVYQLSPDTGDVDEIVTDTGYEIVGAGVSTCAPVELI